MLHRSLIISLLILFSQLTFGQSNEFNLPPKTFYRNAKVALLDFNKFEAAHLKILTDSVNFIHKSSNLNVSLNLDKIDYLRVQEGNQALKWAGYGALFFGLVAVLNVSNSSPYQQVNNPGAIIGGFTVSGAVIGGLIGLAVPKWKTYYVHN